MINEFQASNVSTIINPISAEYSDWIELYNPGPENINISGWYLTDDRLEPDKWQIDIDSILRVGEYMIFWADDRDEFVHTNFKLNRSGEYIGLCDKQQNLIDSISFGYQEEDHSSGRDPDNITEWVIFEIASPGKPNSTSFFSGKTSDPKFSIPGGFYNQGLSVSLSTIDPLAKIYYTRDGTVPDPSDFLYQEPIYIDSTSALRVRTFQDGRLPGNTLTQTYFINEPVNLPFVSLVTDPDHFFDDSTGIYVIGTNGRPGYCADTPMNVNQDWERPVNVELYDITGRMELNQEAGVKIFGGCSRTRYPLKSLALYARSDYGKGSFDCQIFKDKPIYSFESFILRASGDDVVHTMFKDGMAQTLLEEMNIDRQAYRPAVVFINGEYWGIHNIREKINEHYPAGNYNIDSDEINLIKGNKLENHNVMHGSADHYHEMIQYIRRQNLSDERVYRHVAKMMDTDNYLDYQIAEIYLSANDWPMNNIKYWRASSGPYDTWRWIIYDLDNCFFYIDRNTLELATDPWCDCNWPNPPESTLLFRKLLDNKTFRDDFIQRYAFHINTTFQPERVNNIIDSIKTLIEPEIPRHIERWGGKMVPDPEFWIRPLFNSMAEWEENINNMKYFVQERPYHAREHVLDYFSRQGAKKLINLSVKSSSGESGYIKIEDQLIEEDVHEGLYFAGIPITLKAVSKPGYHFKHWELLEQESGSEIIRDPELTISPQGNIDLTAYFEPSDYEYPPIIINEINYHSAEELNPGDWLELYNPTPDIIDLTGWTFSDENDDHIFQFYDDQEIGPYSFIILTEDISAFKNIFPDVVNITGDLGFGLSNGGEVIRLFAPGKILIDSVAYDDSDPWPEEPDGTGATLELLDPSLDNDLAENWRSSDENGTPGAQNFSNRITSNQLQQNYPNPFSNKTILPYTIHNAGFVTIRIYNNLGKEITSLVNEFQEPASYTINWEPAVLQNGIYFYTLQVDNQLVGTKKMIIHR